MAFLASDVMNGARVYLNDVAASIFTNTALLPLVIMANEELEKLLIIIGAEVQRNNSAAITVSANALTITLPVDFLLPISLKERRVGGTENDWEDMTEQIWSPEYVPAPTINYWAFSNNAIRIPGASVNREVLLKYDRQLAVITSSSSPEDFILSKAFLERKTAELAARYIGMNENFANSLAIREVEPARDALERLFILNSQGNPIRRKRFSPGMQSTR